MINKLLSYETADFTIKEDVIEFISPIRACADKHPKDITKKKDFIKF